MTCAVGVTSVVFPSVASVKSAVCFLFPFALSPVVISCPWIMAFDMSIVMHWTLSLAELSF